MTSNDTLPTHSECFCGLFTLPLLSNRPISSPPFAVHSTSSRAFFVISGWSLPVLMSSLFRFQKSPKRDLQRVFSSLISSIFYSLLKGCDGLDTFSPGNTVCFLALSLLRVDIKPSLWPATTSIQDSAPFLTLPPADFLPPSPLPCRWPHFELLMTL